MYSCYMFNKLKLGAVIGDINRNKEEIISVTYCDDKEIAIITKQIEKVVY